ncbi:FAD-binding oxidoreductase [Acidisoma sp. L85]|uniref:FAD-binding oxidoreductase n=1 Tax=Acidisoma sp. L85 TaxID=1641850 RepID=UPI00131CF9E7|nr:FAD-binding oxidoreductase [Acidisoma sp. L85]
MGITKHLIADLGAKLAGRVILPSHPEYDAAKEIWVRTSARPLALVRARSAADVQAAVLAARQTGLPLSVKAGGHDWTGRALCDGIVIDLSEMRGVFISLDGTLAQVGGGARARDLTPETDRLGLAAVTGSVGVVGLGGLTLGGGYGPLTPRFGLASDNLVAAEVVLADGSVVTVSEEVNEELLWALRGGGGNFGVVTLMSLRLHRIRGLTYGPIMYPAVEAAAVFARAADVCRHAPDALTVQLGFISAPDGQEVAAVVPGWCGDPAQAEAEIAPLHRLGTVLGADVRYRSFTEALAMFDGPMTQTHDVFMESCWLADISREVAEVLASQGARRPGPGCSLLTHEFRGAALRVPVGATAFGMRTRHVLLDIVAQYDGGDGLREREWARETVALLTPWAFPATYPNLARRDDPRVQRAYGPNAERLAAAKRRFDPAGLFSSALGLPV